MPNIIINDSKPEFDITNWKSVFETKKVPVPVSEIEFRDVMTDKAVKMPIRIVSEAIISATKWDADTLEEECPSRTSKIDKFLELFDVIYPKSVEKETDKQSEKYIQRELSDNGSETFSETVEDFDAEMLSIDEAQDFFDAHRSKLTKDIDGKISIKAPLLYENMSVTVNSNFRIKYNVESISRNNILITDDKSETVVAVGKIVSKEENDLIVIERDDIDYSAFRNKIQFNIAVLKINNGTFTGEMIFKPVKIQMHAIETTDKVLCIDFGTSNTTAGSYRIKDTFGTEPELVTFADVTQENRLVDYFPTVVYVENCSDPDNIKYKFGFEAKKSEKSNNYESTASVFYQIKQWLIEDSCSSDKITLFDDKGNIAEVSKKSVVCAYLKHVITLSEDYFGVRFKELHFTAPVKMKHKFTDTLKKLLTDYTIIEDGIDEAGAIIFDYVSEKFAKWQNTKQENETDGNVAVIDCGGGTTDLTTCKYEFVQKEDGTKINQIKIDTQFSSGDFNFGGNNITYRIMQLIKLKIAVKYGFITEEEFNKVLEYSENDILQDADAGDYDNSSIYNDFISLYEKCEDFIPTQFNNMSDDFFDDDMPKIKRNFYYLWQFSEQVKIIFYREEKEVKKDKWDDAIQTIGDLKLNYLYQKQGDVLSRLEAPLDDLEITITEIRKVIFGDIYNLLNRILNLENGLPNPIYDYYRLSGQSCKINLFNELLKEFIPGKRLRKKMEKSYEHVESISLKKHCIGGSIRYIMYKRLNMRTELISTSVLAERIYKVSFADLNDEFPSEDATENTIKFYPVTSELDEITVVVRDNKKIIRKISISMKHIGELNNFECKNPDKVINELRKNGNDTINWELTRTKLANFNLNGNNGRAILVVAVPAGNCDGYGFYIHYIKKIIEGTEEKYVVTRGEYYNYETTSLGFFDGKR